MQHRNNFLRVSAFAACAFLSSRAAALADDAVANPAPPPHPAVGALTMEAVPIWMMFLPPEPMRRAAHDPYDRRISDSFLADSFVTDSFDGPAPARTETRVRKLRLGSCNSPSPRAHGDPSREASNARADGSGGGQPVGGRHPSRRERGASRAQ